MAEIAKSNFLSIKGKLLLCFRTAEFKSIVLREYIVDEEEVIIIVIPIDSTRNHDPLVAIIARQNLNNISK